MAKGKPRSGKSIVKEYQEVLKRIRAPRGVKVEDRLAKSILTASKIPGMKYALNPYVGCAHACRYCYVRLMQRFFGHRGETWGSFVDVKQNAPRLLIKELTRKRKGTVMLASATDPYQPLENRLKITRACLELLADARFPVSVLTKSALIIRDLDLLKDVDDLSVGITVTTDDERVRRVMEPRASSIPDRLIALEALAGAGLSPHVFIGPILPMDPKALAKRLEPLARLVYFDRMNYPSLTRGLIRQRRWQMVFDHNFTDHVIETFGEVFGQDRVEAICE
jgi:DNA repair photolyase